MCLLLVLKVCKRLSYQAWQYVVFYMSIDYCDIHLIAKFGDKYCLKPYVE